MPCEAIYTVRTELDENVDLGLMQRALQSLGQMVIRSKNSLTFTSGSFNRDTGTLTLKSSGMNVNEIVRAYSLNVVNEIARQNGWELKWRVNSTGNFETSVQKVGYVRANGHYEN